MKPWDLLRRIVIGPPNDPYLDRLGLIRTPWFSIKLHRIYRPDNTRALHDHPWTFVSVPLRGSYVELVPMPNGSARRRVRWFNYKHAEDAHAIVEISRRPVWTLVFCGRRVRPWGFYTDAGWVPWAEYGGEA